MNDNDKKKRANFTFNAIAFVAMPVLFLTYCGVTFGRDAVFAAIFGLSVVALWIEAWPRR
jgi:hypothetical protein